MAHDKSNLYEGLEAMARKSLCPWDDYYARMAQTDFFLGRERLTASKTYFLRQAPFGGSYALLGGITEFLRQVRSYRFTDEVGEVLLAQGYRKPFVDYLVKTKRYLDLCIFAPPEGSLFFPSEPVVSISGGIIDVRLAEGMLLECLNYPTLAMTKWSRVIFAAGLGSVMEFSRRRAQDHLRTTLYGYLAGTRVSSNSEIRTWFDIPTVGTMGHEWIQSFGDEFAAFNAWLEENPDRPTLLVDTVDTLSSGIPNAIEAFKEHKDKIAAAKGAMGVRLDSGDLAYLAMESCKRLWAAGLEAKVFMTNDLDERSIQSIKSQIEEQAPEMDIDASDVLLNLVWACGTKPGTCWDQPSAGGVAKLTSVNADGKRRSVIKLARDNPIKTSIPGENLSAFYLNKEGHIEACLIYGRDEDLDSIGRIIHPDDESKYTEVDHSWIVIRRQRMYKNHDEVLGQYRRESLQDIRRHVIEELQMLHWTNRRIEKPHSIKVGLSPKLFSDRRFMITERKLIY